SSLEITLIALCLCVSVVKKFYHRDTEAQSLLLLFLFRKQKEAIEQCKERRPCRCFGPLTPKGGTLILLTYFIVLFPLLVQKIKTGSRKAQRMRILQASPKYLLSA